MTAGAGEASPRTPKPASAARRRPGVRRRRYRLLGAAVLLVLIAVAVVFRDRIFITIPAGHVGVQWSRFFGGTIIDHYHDEGMHIIVPWNKMILYDVRFQMVEEDFTALSNDGLAIETGIAFRFVPKRETIAELHSHIGPEYLDVLIRPEVAAIVREAVSRVSPAALYDDAQRIDLQNLMAKKLARRIGLPSEIVDEDLLEATLDSRALAAEERLALDDDTDDQKDPERKRKKKRGKDFGKNEDREFFKVEDIMITLVVLPEGVAGAIENKLVEQQRHLEYVYRLQKEEKEEQRKIIESEGIAEFQRIAGVSLPKWRGLDATLRLAEDPNAQLVFAGSQESGGLPVLLGPLVDGDPTLPPAPPAGNP